MPASAAATGDGGGGSTYQSPGTPPTVGHHSREAAARGDRGAGSSAGSPAATTSRAAAMLRVRSDGETGASVAASRQRAGSVATNVRTGTRATSASVRDRKRVSQSGGAASITIAGAGLTSTTKRRASSRGSSSPTPSSRTSAADHPLGRREAGSVSSVATTPLSGSVTSLEARRRPASETVSTACSLPSSPFPGLLPAVLPGLLPAVLPGLLPAVPYPTLSRIVSPAATRRGPSTDATNASKNEGRGSTTRRARPTRSGATSGMSAMAPSVTTITGPTRAAAAVSAGPSRLAPSAGGSVSKARTARPKRQITPSAARPRAVSSAARHGPPWPALLSDASSKTSGGPPGAERGVTGVQRSSASAATPVARSSSKPALSRPRTRAPPRA